MTWTIDGAASPAAAGSAERQLRLWRDAAGGWTTTSEALLGSEGRLTILHDGEPYQLRLTRQHKLILTK